MKSTQNQVRATILTDVALGVIKDLQGCLGRDQNDVLLHDAQVIGKLLVALWDELRGGGVNKTAFPAATRRHL